MDTAAQETFNMGMYTWLSEDEFKRFSRVEDEYINEVLQEVRAIDTSWYVDERTFIIKRFLRKSITQTHYTIYSQFYRNSVFSETEVYVQASASTKNDVLNFLYGLNVGLHFEKQ